MCSQCSFQVALRALRQRRTPAATGHALPSSARRGYHAVAAHPPVTSSQTSSLAFTLPTLPLQSLAQSYSSFTKWRQRGSLKPTAVLKPLDLLKSEENKYPTKDDLNQLLHSMAVHTESWQDLDGVVAPVLAKMLAGHHYAGARAVLERVLEETWKTSTLVPSSVIASILALLIGDSVKQQKQDGRLLNKPVMQSLLRLLLQHFTTFPDKYEMSREIITAIAARPEYLDRQSLDMLIELFKRALDEMDRGHKLATNVPFLHNIMRALALQGRSDEAEQWLLAIEQVLRGRVQSKSTPSRADSGASARDRPVWPSTQTPSNLNASVAMSVKLGTTYISSLARREQVLGEMLEAESKTALSYFDKLWKQQRESETVGDGEYNLDIYAWSAILHAAALDVSKVSTSALLGVFEAIKSYNSLPDPNAVTYTSLLNGLNLRGKQKEAIRIFETTVVREAKRTMKQQLRRIDKGSIATGVVLDAQLLGTVVRAWAELGELDKAMELLDWFGAKRADNFKGEYEGVNVVPSSMEEAQAPLGTALASSQRDYMRFKAAVKVDVILINQVMGHLAAAQQYNAVYDIFSQMQEIYGVAPDDVSLAILARSALTVAQQDKRGLVPDQSEDVWRMPSKRSDGRRNGSQTSSGKATTKSLRAQWGGREPYAYVLSIYWAILEQNADKAASIAQKTTLRTSARNLFGFAESRDHQSSLFPIPDAAQANVVRQVEAAHITSGLRQSGREPVQYDWPSILPTQINMHLLIALSSYFGRGSEIPLIFSHMKSLGLQPMDKTICLALWAFEETGAYTTEIRRFRAWLVDWLGHEGVPTDEDVAYSRRMQWGAKRG